MHIAAIQGHVFPPRDVVPERNLSGANYARVLGSDDERFYSSEAAQQSGFDSRPLPLAMLTFFHTMDESDLLNTLGVTYGKTLFGGIEFEFGAVATERQKLVGQTRVAEAYERPGKDGVMRQFLVLQTEFHTPDGNLVSRSRLTFMEKVD